MTAFGFRPSGGNGVVGSAAEWPFGVDSCRSAPEEVNLKVDSRSSGNLARFAAFSSKGSSLPGVRQDVRRVSKSHLDCR